MIINEVSFLFLLELPLVWLKMTIGNGISVSSANTKESRDSVKRHDVLNYFLKNHTNILIAHCSLIICPGKK